MEGKYLNLDLGREKTMATYPLAKYTVLHEFFHDRPDATEITLDEAAARYEAEEPRAGIYILDEQERQFVALCAYTYPKRLLDRWLR